VSYNPQAVARYFDELAAGEWDRLVRSPLEEIKLHIHTHYLQRYIPRGSRVLEVGAGPGRFTQVLHELGCQVVVTDISPVQLELNRKQAAALGFAAAVEGWLVLDICDMAALEPASFAAVVCYGGPLSYVFEQRDRALQECLRVLQPGGLLLSSAMSLWGTIHQFLAGVLELPVAVNRAILAAGHLTPQTQPDSRHHCHLYTAQEYRALHERHGLEVLAMSASNALSTQWMEVLEQYRDVPEKWALLLEMERAACAQPGYLDGGTHIIAVARKGP
jgi:SAM-dependent methyltransferase